MRNIYLGGITTIIFSECLAHLPGGFLFLFFSGLMYSSLVLGWLVLLAYICTSEKSRHSLWVLKTQAPSFCTTTGLLKTALKFPPWASKLMIELFCFFYS
jgi:hypothetical protein